MSPLPLLNYNEKQTRKETRTRQGERHKRKREPIAEKIRANLPITHKDNRDPTNLGARAQDEFRRATWVTRPFQATPLRGRSCPRQNRPDSGRRGGGAVG